MTNSLSRRSFLGSLAAAGAAGVVSAPVLAQTVTVPAKWDKTVDFLIVGTGTGFAGLGAAIEAHEQGIKNVLVIDKMPSYGGNSIINGGAVAAAWLTPNSHATSPTVALKTTNGSRRPVFSSRPSPSTAVTPYPVAMP